MKAAGRVLPGAAIHHILMMISASDDNQGNDGHQPRPGTGVILSKSANYAVRAALCLATDGEGRPVPVDAIAERLDVPRNYLSKILYALARGGVLISTRGPGGGFRLASPAESLSLSDVVEHFDTIPDEDTCFLGQSSCSETEPCRAHTRWADVRGSITDFLDNTYLADLANEPGFDVESQMTVGSDPTPA